MIVAMVVAGAAVLVAVVYLAVGKGGELAEAHPDHPPLALPGDRPIGGTDAAMLQLPRGLWGYHVDITDEALERLAIALSERDARIAVLEQRITMLQADLTATGRPSPAAASAPPASAPAPAQAHPAPAPAPAHPAPAAGPAAEPEPHIPGEQEDDRWAPVDSTTAGSTAAGAAAGSGSAFDAPYGWTPQSAYEHEPEPPGHRPLRGWWDERPEPPAAEPEPPDAEPTATAASAAPEPAPDTAEPATDVRGRADRPG